MLKFMSAILWARGLPASSADQKPASTITWPNGCDITWTAVSSSLTGMHSRRVSCPTPRMRQVRLSRAQAGSHFTNLFKALAIDVLLATSVKKAAEFYKLPKTMPGT